MTAYVCGTDWQHECHDVIYTVKFFNTIESLKRNKKCWKECGIVEVKLTETKWATDPILKYGKKINSAKAKDSSHETSS